MKKKHSNKEVSRLRAEVEALRTRLKELGPLGEVTDLRTLKGMEGGVAFPSNPVIPPPVQPDSPGTAVATETYLRQDLKRTFFLTTAVLSFFLSLKLVILPNTDKISQNLLNFYQLTTKIPSWYK